MSYLLQSGDTFTPAVSKESLLDRLPPGNYTVEESMTGMFFKRTEAFKPAPRLYGKLPSYADRILRSFEDRPGNTGVLLQGEKGSGKSLLARLVSERAAEAGMATVMVNRAYGGDKLGPLLNHLTSPVVVFLDEFEKTYSDREVQESVLSLLDGSGTSRHLFILTINDAFRLDSHLKNRPGRLYYSIEFTGLEPSFIREYCEDRLADKTQIEAVVTLTSMFESFNFDMLKALVEEMNRYDETAAEAVQFLNVTPTDNQDWYDLKVFDGEGNLVKGEESAWYGSPLSLDSYEVELDPDATSSTSPLAEWERELLRGDAEAKPVSGDFEITLADLVSFSAPDKTYTFHANGYVVTLSGRVAKGPTKHWAQLF